MDTSVWAFYLPALQCGSPNQAGELRLSVLLAFLLDLPLGSTTEISASHQEQHFLLAGEMKDTDSNFE